MYFTFTSLSTVGFGDYYPHSDVERLVCALILLSGVIIFTFICGVFNSILDAFINLNAGLDEGDKLTRFFNIIRYFNDEVPVDLELKKRVEGYFDYKWENDLN